VSVIGVNELAVASMTGELASLRKRVEELEARALLLGSDAAPPSECCQSYCCTTTLEATLNVGDVLTLCQTDVEGLGGLDLRVEVDGWVSFRANAGGHMEAIVWVEVDGSTYIGASRFGETVLVDDYATLPWGNTVDPGSTTPVVRGRIQNIGSVAITVRQVHSKIRVGNQDGSIGCGEIAGSGGPT
jgi:hypothetical protein